MPTRVMLLNYSTMTLCQVFAVKLVDDELGVVSFQELFVESCMMVLTVQTFYGGILRHLNCRSG